MNAVEIEQAVSAFFAQSFEAGEFPFAFLKAFGNKETTIKRLRKGGTNHSELGGVLQRNNIHIKTCPAGEVTPTLAALKSSPATGRAKAKFALATDGEWLEAEALLSGETLACAYGELPDHFGFFLPLAGISTVKEIRDSAFDIKATGRLNTLYIALLQDNPDWGGRERRHDMNHFMARLIFCFFAEDTDIFSSAELFTTTIERMSARDSANTHEVMGEIFRAMNTPIADRATAKIPRWANAFPYVDGGLFSGRIAVPRFSRIARSYLSHIGGLDWKRINPDIFGSMIQAVTEPQERGALGQHYTSAPNIRKVLDPLFLDDLRSRLDEAGDSPRKLLNLRKRLARIRVFDPACGSGNFLVIAYKEMRAIEAELNEKRGEAGRKSDIPLRNFRGIELRDFAAEIARLALIIAEYQCDELYRGQKEALQEFLPLDENNWITHGNALRLDWLSLCPPAGREVKHQCDDLLYAPERAPVDFENEGGETYICGNPPYRGSTWQAKQQKEELQRVFAGRTKQYKSLDYVAGWVMKAADYGVHTPTVCAFVTTNSICQGRHVPILWPLILETGHEIAFAHSSFKWNNLASHNAGVTVVIVGLSNHAGPTRRLFVSTGTGKAAARDVANINPYLAAGPTIIVESRSKPLSALAEMNLGNMPVDGGHLLLSRDEVDALNLRAEQKRRFIRPFLGSKEFIRGLSRYCLWIEDEHLGEALSIASIAKRIEGVRAMRLASSKAPTRDSAAFAHRFGEVRQTGKESTIIVPRVSSENRAFLPVGVAPTGTVIGDSNFALYDAPLWTMALIASRLHLVWIATVCGKLKTDYRYSNTLGWNTFPVPTLTAQNKADLTLCAKTILLAREAHFPSPIAELYKPGAMPENLRYAHARNDEMVERIYIGRKFRNDSERLEKLFDLYTKMKNKLEKS